jgi:hypothetical protein
VRTIFFRVLVLGGLSFSLGTLAEPLGYKSLTCFDPAGKFRYEQSIDSKGAIQTTWKELKSSPYLRPDPHKESVISTVSSNMAVTALLQQSTLTRTVTGDEDSHWSSESDSTIKLGAHFAFKKKGDWFETEVDMICDGVEHRHGTSGKQ